MQPYYEPFVFIIVYILAKLFGEFQSLVCPITGGPFEVPVVMRMLGRNCLLCCVGAYINTHKVWLTVSDSAQANKFILVISWILRFPLNLSVGGVFIFFRGSTVWLT